MSVETYVLGTQSPVLHVSGAMHQRREGGRGCKKSHSREHLQIRLWRRTPLIHEDEMDIRRTKPRPSTKIVWVTGCRWFYDHILRGEFNVHCRHSIDGSGNDGVGTKLSPQVVGATDVEGLRPAASLPGRSDR